tara:strand:- start:114 stop:422 length:309 start_codon:yes stop_codon:yes gene_type:complete
MEVEVKEALRTLTDGNARVDTHQALWLRERLKVVDNKFKLLRTEISRLNASLADQKDRNDALLASLSIVKAENAELKTSVKSKAPPQRSGSTNKKKTTKKKK